MKANRLRGHLAALAAALVLATGGAVAQTHSTLTQQQCQTAWNDAPAKDYCPNITVGVFNDSYRDDQCTLTGTTTCSISVNVGQSVGTSISQTFSAENASSWFSGGHVGQPSHVDQLDLCFTKAAGETTWQANIDYGCGGDAIDSGTATSSGLPYVAQNCAYGGTC